MKKKSVKTTKKSKKVTKKKKPVLKLKNKSKSNKKDNIFKQNYFEFSKHVLKVIFKNKKFFIKLGSLMVVIGIVLLGVMSQHSYNIFQEMVNYKIKDQTFFGTIKKSGILLSSVFDTGGFAIGFSEVKNIYFALIMILTWLAVVKFLRLYLANKKPDFKDTIYSCGTPIISLLINIFFLTLKILPLAIIIILYSLISKSLFFENMINLAILRLISLLLVAINIYWLVPSLISLAVITLPGMYPMDSISFSKSLVEGQRFKIILRLLWHLLWVLTFWVVIMIPIITLDNLFISKIFLINKIPIIPFVMIVMTIISSIWTFVYFYFIYRRLMENDQSAIKKRR